MTCSPTQCCPCHGPFFIKPGERTNIIIDWSEWLSSQPGYSLTDNPASTAAIKNISGATPVSPPASEAQIVASGPLSTNMSRVTGTNNTRIMIEIGAATPVGTKYKIDFVQYARGCDADMGSINMPDCILVEVANC